MWHKKKIKLEITTKQEQLLNSIFSKEQLLLDPFSRVACSADASFYRLIPKAIVKPHNNRQIQQLIKIAPQLGLSMTFRGAGTSLSGQAISEDILVEIGHGELCQFQIFDKGTKVQFGPGVRGGLLNQYLHPYQKKIGPDPASIHVAMMGGILANNSSGMCCGTSQNSYQTLESMCFFLANGYRLDSAWPEAHQRFRQEQPHLAQGIMQIREQLLANPTLCSFIRKKFQLKNTSGYGLNSFLDFTEPLDIFIHLLIGSEGTLAFIENAVLNTVPDPPYKRTGWAIFESLHEAVQAVTHLEKCKANAIEVMDITSLNVLSKLKYLQQTNWPQDSAALLIEFCADSKEKAASFAQQAQEILSQYRLYNGVDFTEIHAQREKLWAMRKGLFPAVGGIRPQGTTVVIEDVCVFLPDMPAFIKDLRQALKKTGYLQHVIFGHAKDGNLHFVMNADFNTQKGIDLYARFMEETVQKLVSVYGGSLKAEHGTGRNMAPFLSREWGNSIYEIMVKIKKLFDPNDIFNPGVIINNNPQGHLENLKQICDIGENKIDSCMECGFCEAICPSSELTLSPRQRIVAMRAMQKMPINTNMANYNLETTCAADGLCALRCPLKINVGEYIKEKRAKQAPHKNMANFLAQNMGFTIKILRLGLSLATMLRSFYWGREIMAHLSIPTTSYLPRAQAKVYLPVTPEISAGKFPVIYFPTCLNLAFGLLPGEKQPMPLPQAVVTVLQKLGFSVFTPQELQHSCCSLAFASKGYKEATEISAKKTLLALTKHSKNGQIPIVVDVAPCASQLKEKAKEYALQIYELSEFLLERAQQMPNIKKGHLILHPTCSMVKEGTDQKLLALMKKVSQSCTVPTNWSCCAHAGDRGFLVPELTQSATKEEAKEVCTLLQKKPQATLLSGCKTCEIGISQAVGKSYSSYVFHLLDILKG